MRNYPRYILLAAPHNSTETPSWMIDGICKKMYFEAFNRAVENLPSNPNSEAGVLGRKDGTKKLKLLRLIKGEEEKYDYKLFE